MMPRETITEQLVSSINGNELSISWNKIGWVQAGVQPFNSANMGYFVDLTPRAITKLIKVLKKAKRQAYGNGYTHPGFSDFNGNTVEAPSLIPIPGGAEVITEPIRDAIVVN